MKEKTGKALVGALSGDLTKGLEEAAADMDRMEEANASEAVPEAAAGSVPPVDHSMPSDASMPSDVPVPAPVFPPQEELSKTGKWIHGKIDIPEGESLNFVKEELPEEYKALRFYIKQAFDRDMVFFDNAK